jgi:hypothetical protein
VYTLSRTARCERREREREKMWDAVQESSFTGNEWGRGMETTCGMSSPGYYSHTVRDCGGSRVLELGGLVHLAHLGTTGRT